MKFAYYNEIDPFCVRVLRKQIAAGHLPAGVVDDRDIRSVQPDDLRGFRQVHLFAGIGGIPLGFRWAGVPDDCPVWTGGFPCQDISQAGQGAGIDGARSGLWFEYARLIRVLRPRHVVVENVAALLGRGLGVVLGDLASCGYDAEWDCIPAAAVGAPHRRDRLFVLAHAQRLGVDPGAERTGRQAGADAGRGGARATLADAVSQRRGTGGQRSSGETLALTGGAAVADANRLRQPQPAGRVGEQRQRTFDGGEGFGDGGWWLIEPPVGRVAHGVPGRVDRLRGLGNAVVPQVAEFIGRSLLGVL